MVAIKKVEKPFKLSHMIWEKRYFNPFAKTDVTEYKFFLDKNQWRNGCPFLLEWPYLTIPEMIKCKLIDAHIEGMIKSGK